MIVIIFKAILSSALFLLAYKLLLEKEKMHQFNRFYLLFSLFLSFVIPFLTIRISVLVSVPFETALINTDSLNTSIISPQDVSVTEVNYLSTITWTTYGVITLFLIVRFVMNLKTISDKISNASVIPFKNSKLVLVNENLTPHSFLNYIFVNKEEHEKGNIEEEILLHELTHARQKHTLDIILIELTLVFFWVNPFLNIYRKAMQLNHEFLADEEVIRLNHNLAAYQHLLVTKSADQTNSVFMSPFNFLITKQRLIMMTKTTSLRVAAFKQGISTLFIGAILITFSVKSYGQEKSESPKETRKNAQESSSGKNETSESEKIYYLKESFPYPPQTTPTRKSPTLTQLQSWMNSTQHGVWIDGERIANEKLGNYQPEQFSSFYETQRSKGTQIVLMTPEYYEQFLKRKPQKPYEIKHIPDANLPKVLTIERKSPTAYQLQNWMESEKYGVWLDGKRIINAELLKYEPTDFALFFESKLAKNAKNYGKHYYQVNLMTPRYYEEVFLKEMEKFRI